jgi:hypothetical protein
MEGVSPSSADIVDVTSRIQRLPLRLGSPWLKLSAFATAAKAPASSA